ncbi:hypothetical protein CHRYSEOSP005_11430 [Chryseobacterium sp. Alg-005]|uniref:hypothetical protein n=1 Tax=Chryseobacterium sp. Alg-005 TaxID=3159516 RepID=UPI003555B46E
MKTKFLILLMIGFFANLWTAQTLVKPADFKLSGVTSYLKGKGYTIVEENPEYLEVTTKNNADVFLDVDAKNQVIYYSSNILVNTSASKDKIREYIEMVNNKMPMFNVVYVEEKQKAMFQYTFWIKYGFTYESLEDSLSEFGLYVGDALDLDKEQKILQ